MSLQIEVHVDHVRGLLAVAWPTRPGYTIYSEHGWPTEYVLALPAGMTRLQDPAPAERPAAASCATTRPSAVVPRQRQPRPEEATA